MTLRSIIVGSHFSPPAKVLLKCIPAGARVALRAEPENPYDSNAIQVTIRGSELHEGALRGEETALAGTGFGADEVLARAEPWVLGHVAASNGKPLAKATPTVGFVLVGTLELADLAARLGETIDNLLVTVSFIGELAVLSISED